jgi:hypothetical protein
LIQFYPFHQNLAIGQTLPHLDVPAGGLIRGFQNDLSFIPHLDYAADFHRSGDVRLGDRWEWGNRRFWVSGRLWLWRLWNFWANIPRQSGQPGHLSSGHSGEFGQFRRFCGRAEGDWACLGLGRRAGLARLRSGSRAGLASRWLLGNFRANVSRQSGQCRHLSPCHRGECGHFRSLRGRAAGDSGCQGLGRRSGRAAGGLRGHLSAASHRPVGRNVPPAGALR